MRHEYLTVRWASADNLSMQLSFPGSVRVGYDDDRSRSVGRAAAYGDACEKHTRQTARKAPRRDVGKSSCKK